MLPRARPGPGELQQLCHRMSWHQGHPCSNRRAGSAPRGPKLRSEIGQVELLRQRLPAGFPAFGPGAEEPATFLGKRRLNENLLRSRMHRRPRLRFRLAICKRNNTGGPRATRLSLCRNRRPSVRARRAARRHCLDPACLLAPVFQPGPAGATEGRIKRARPRPRGPSRRGSQPRDAWPRCRPVRRGHGAA